MITGVPSKEYYLERSENLLHLAASIFFELYPDDFGYDHDEETLEEYWLKCQPALSNALTLIQQAQELGLKGRISQTSPFLLISRDPRDWPKNSSTTDIAFSAFRTADAADLPRLHDTVCTTRLSSSQTELFEKIRSHRNLIIHHGTVEKITPEEVIYYIIKTFAWLHEGLAWGESRQSYLDNDKLATLYSTDHVINRLNDEFGHICDAIPPADFKLIFGFDKKTRWYWCDMCRMAAHDEDITNKTAKLQPNSPSSTSLCCLACNSTFEVTRQACQSSDCKGNVFSALSGENLCMSCLEEVTASDDPQ